MALIEVTDVTFRYNTQSDDEMAIRDVNYSIKEGEFVGITGKSGAGKATFCRLLAGQIPNFYQGDIEGSVTVDGIETAEKSLGELASTIGYVFENPYDQLTGATSTVLEEVAFGLESMGLSRKEIRDRAKSALEQIGIEELADRHPQRLSGGQCQRVAIASVLAMRPEILILQQPTAQLDPEGTDEVMRVVAEMNDKGYTVVMVTQDLTRLAPHLDQLLVFDNGEIHLDGSPREVLTTAEKQDLPILVPAPVRVGHRLRETGYVDPATPVPVTFSECVEELAPLVNNGVQRSAPAAGQSQAIATDGSNPPVTADTPGDEDNNASNAPLSLNSDDRIVLNDLHHTYPSGVQALQGLSFSMNEGCVCIIGQNGAGKSTLVKHLNGLLDPTEGQVVVEGHDTTEHRVAELAQYVGLSFQNPDDQLFHNTVEDEIRYGPQNLDYDDETIEMLVEQAIEAFDLEESREKNPYDLVMPWRKRVAVASTAAMDTPVIVLDEPTSGQDAPGHAALSEFIDDLVEQGKLVIVITHDMHFVSDNADRVVVLSEANLLMDGSPREVLVDRETLHEADVQSPAITRIGLEAGISEPVLSVEELMDVVEGKQN